MSLPTVLVTGGSGFIGSHAVAALRDRFDVHVVSRRPRRTAEGPRVHAVDLHDHARVRSLLETLRPEYLLHLAWDVTPGRYPTSLENLPWLESSIHLLHAFVQCGGRRMVGAGTCDEYDWHAGQCEESTTPLAPTSLYAATKHAVAQVMAAVSRQTGLSAAWGRVFFLYGPGEAAVRLVPSMVAAARQAASFPLRYPEQVRDYTHVADIGAAFAALLQSDVQGPVNVASGTPVRLESLAGIIGEAVGRPLRIDRSAAATQDPYPVVTADVTRLRRDVGFTPRFTLEDGVRDTVAWWEQHHTVRA